MTPKDLVEGFISGKRRVVLLPFEDQPEERGTILGYYCDLENEDVPTERDIRTMIDDCFFVVQVDKRYRSRGDDGVRDGVAADQIEWEKE